MIERKTVSLGERWRREATRGIDDVRLAQALEALPSIRKPMVRIRAGSIRAEMEGSMGSIHEVSLQIRTLSQKDWPTLVRVLRRSKSIIDALEHGRVPRSFDRIALTRPHPQAACSIASVPPFVKNVLFNVPGAISDNFFDKAPRTSVIIPG